jgi:hypothetical protein
MPFHRKWLSSSGKSIISLIMKIRGLVFIALLVICIVVKLLTWLPISSHLFIAFLVYGESLSGLVFFGILASVLGISKERIWIVVIAWVTLVACLVEEIQLLTGHHFLDTDTLLDFKSTALLKVLLYVALLFARQGPLQVLLRWLAVIPVIPLLMPHLNYPHHHIPPLAIAVAAACITLLQYILLIDIVAKTPELQSAQGIEFP